MEKNRKEEKSKRSAKKLLISVGSIFILVLAAVSFVFIPAMVQGTGTELPPFGYYDKKPIEYKQGSYFASSVQYYMDQIGSQNQELTMSDEFNAFNNAFASTVHSMAYTQAVTDSGYVVPNSLLDRNMRTYFHDENGVFSQKLFNSASDGDKLELRDSLVNSLEYARYDNDLFGSQTEVMGNYSMYGLKTSSKEAPFIQKMGENQRSFEYVLFDTASYPREEAAAWAQNQPELFTKYDMSVISVASKAEADKLLKQLEGNELLFEDAAAEFSRNYYSGTDGKLTGSYNYQIKGIVRDEASLDEITSLGAGATSGVIETLNGFSIFRADAQPVSPDFGDEALVDAVISYMSTYETGIIESYFLDMARDFANTAAQNGFAEAGAEFGLTVEAISSTPLNYGDNPLLQSLSATNSALSGASRSEEFLKTAFSIRPGEISSPVVLGKSIIVMRLAGEESVEGNDMMYQYYTNSFDRASVSAAIMSSDKLENNLMDVYFKYAFN